MAQFIIYSSGDASAPVLDGQAGSLITVLDAILVNGYGAKAAAGWTKAFSATNQAAYTMGAGTGFSLSVDDDGPGAGTYKEARIRGFEVPSSATAGSGQFPSATQGIASAGYLCFRKSNTLNSTARDWICFADDLTIYFFAFSGDTALVYQTFGFGDFYSLVGSSDLWRCAIIGRGAENSTSATIDPITIQSPPNTATAAGGAAVVTHYAPRTFGGTGSSIVLSKHGDVGKTNAASWSNVAAGGFGAAGIQTPNSADNAYYVSPVWVCEPSSSVVRGRMRGFWHLCHAASGFTDGQVVSGTNDFAGKTFQVVKWLTAVTTGNCCLIEISNTLESN